MGGKGTTHRKDARSEEQLRREWAAFVPLCPGLDGNALRLLFYLQSRLNFSEPVRVTQVELVSLLGWHQSHISRSLKRLMDAGILLPGEGGSRSSKWQLNPEFGK